MTRRIRWAGSEHQRREVNAQHVHFDGVRAIYGNGETVLIVLRGQGHEPVCEVVGEDGLNYDGGEFRYSDYFLPEELAL